MVTRFWKWQIHNSACLGPQSMSPEVVLVYTQHHRSIYQLSYIRTLIHLIYYIVPYSHFHLFPPFPCAHPCGTISLAETNSSFLSHSFKYLTPSPALWVQSFSLFHLYLTVSFVSLSLCCFSFFSFSFCILFL